MTQRQASETVADPDPERRTKKPPAANQGFLKERQLADTESFSQITLLTSAPFDTCERNRSYRSSAVRLRRIFYRLTGASTPVEVTV